MLSEGQFGKQGMRHAKVTSPSGFVSTVGAISGEAIEDIVKRGGKVEPMTASELQRHRTASAALTREKIEAEWRGYRPGYEEEDED